MVVWKENSLSDSCARKCLRVRGHGTWLGLIHWRKQRGGDRWKQIGNTLVTVEPEWWDNGGQHTILFTFGHIWSRKTNKHKEKRKVTERESHKGEKMSRKSTQSLLGNTMRSTNERTAVRNSNKPKGDGTESAARYNPSKTERPQGDHWGAPVIPDHQQNLMQTLNSRRGNTFGG